MSFQQLMVFFFLFCFVLFFWDDGNCYRIHAYDKNRHAVLIVNATAECYINLIVLFVLYTTLGRRVWSTTVSADELLHWSNVLLSVHLTQIICVQMQHWELRRDSLPCALKFVWYVVNAQLKSIIFSSIPFLSESLAPHVKSDGLSFCFDSTYIYQDTKAS